MQLDLFDPSAGRFDVSAPQPKRSSSKGERAAKAKREPPSFETRASALPAKQHLPFALEPAFSPEPEADGLNRKSAPAAGRKRRGLETSTPVSAAKLDLRPPELDPEVGIDLGLADVNVTPQVDTIADALAWYEDAVSTHPRRAHIRSAFRAVERVLGLPANEIPASPEKLRLLLEKASPGRAGMKPRTWIQAKSTATSGLRALGVQIAAGRDSTPMSAEWGKLSAELPDRKLQIGLSRLLRFLSRTGRTPEDVTPSDFEAFRQELLTASVARDAAGAYRQAARMWNKAVATVAGWPQVVMASESDPRRYSFEWSRFPPSLVEDVEAFLASRSTTNPLDDDYTPSIRRATATGRSKSLRQIASALVLSGGAKLDEVTGLRVLTEFENVRKAISYLMEEKQGGELTEGHLNLIWLLRTIARHWLKDEDQAQQIAGLLTNVRKHLDKTGARGLTSKNRDRLRQFDIPANVEALIALPTRVLHSVRAMRGSNHRQSVRLMQALQVGLLTFVPIRSKNLAGLKLGTNLIDVRKGTKRLVRIHLSASETKTAREYDAPIPAHLHPLLDLWLGEHRKRVCLADSPYLFPNPRGELRSRDALAAKLQGFVRRELGLEINPHLFRHIAAKLYLDRDPSGIEIVRQLLGHTSSRTTLRVYAELQTDPAFRRLEAALLQVDYRPPSRRPAPGATPSPRRAQ